jgi:hypothetical protein
MGSSSLLAPPSSPEFQVQILIATATAIAIAIAIESSIRCMVFGKRLILLQSIGVFKNHSE